MLRQLLLAATVFAVSTSLPAAAQAQTDDASRFQLEGIAAIVNDKPISYSDVRQRARFMLLSMGGAQPSSEQIQQITGQALEQLIDENLQMQKAEEYELEISQEEVDQEVSQMAAGSGLTGDALKQQLISSGVNPNSLEDKMRAELAWSHIMSGLYGRRIRISDNQVDDQLGRLRAAAQKTQYRVSEIFLYAPDADLKSQALQASGTIIEQLKQGADFRVAAQRLSSAPTAATGGDMGWISTGDLSPELAAAVSQAEGPGILPPVEVENGVYILLVAGKRDPAESTTKVDLIRLAATDGKESTLQAAVDQITGCENVQSIANTKTELRASKLEDMDVETLGPEGRALVMATEVGQPTSFFPASGGLATMYVCRKDEGAEALPSREDLKDNLKNRELSMISERELRDMRRKATIIYR